MTVLEELTREFGDAAVASAIIESLLDNGLKIRSGTIEARSRGFTGAQLAKALVEYATGQPKPRWCVIKFCPSVRLKHQRENQRHLAALREAPGEFSRQHLVEIAFPTAACPQDAFVVGQFVHGRRHSVGERGSRPTRRRLQGDLAQDAPGVDR